MNTKLTLKIENLSFAYYRDEYVFENLSLELNESSLFAIIGSNGSGKTTLLNCISGYYKSNHGAVTLNNEKIELFKREISHIAPNFDLIPYLTIRENIDFFLAFYKKDSSEERIIELLKAYYLADYQNKFLESCSKGMRKKLQIIISFLAEPKLLLCDEPFDGLDYYSAKQLTKDLYDFIKKGNIAIVINHDLEWVTEHATQLFNMNLNRIVSAESMDFI